MSRNLSVSFENMACSENDNYCSFRKYDFVRKYVFSKKVNYLLRVYNCFVRKDDVFKENEFICFENYNSVDQKQSFLLEKYSGSQDPAMEEPLPASAWAPFAQIHQ